VAAARRHKPGKGVCVRPSPRLKREGSNEKNLEECK
jgi:hypothetical protein